MLWDACAARRGIVFLFFVAALTLCSLAAGAKKIGDAVVLGKEHIPPAELSVSPNEQASPNSAEPSATPLMRPEQWLVQVEMVTDLKKVDVQAERSRWEALRKGDRVHVTYRQGKYTGTVWSAELD